MSMISVDSELISSMLNKCTEVTEFKPIADLIDVLFGFEDEKKIVEAKDEVAPKLPVKEKLDPKPQVKDPLYCVEIYIKDCDEVATVITRDFEDYVDYMDYKHESDVVELGSAQGGTRMYVHCRNILRVVVTDATDGDLLGSSFGYKHE